MYVVKTLRFDSYTSSEFKAQFDVEATILASLPPHPYVVPIVFVGQLDEGPGIIMEYAVGGDLGQRMASKALDVFELLGLARQVCVGMQYLNESAGVLHHDLKPQNLLVNSRGDIWVADFGLSSYQRYALERLGGNSAGDLGGGQQRIRPGGTLPYMSPEHFGDGEFTTASDVYSMGIILYEALEGRRPFVGRAPKDYLSAHLRQVPPAVKRPGTPKSLVSLISKCLEKDQSQRFQSFAELDVAIDEVSPGKRKVAAPKQPTVSEMENTIDALGWTMRGFAFGKLKRFEDSLRCYSRALERNPRDGAAHSNMGTALDRLGRYDDALPYYERGVELAPLTQTHMALATAYERRERLTDALRVYQAALEADRSHITVYRHIVWILRRLGRSDEVDQFIEEAKAALIDSDAGPLNWINEGVQYGQRLELKESLSFLLKCAELYPTDARAWYNLGVTYIFMLPIEPISIDYAVAAVARAIAIDPRSGRFLYLQGLIALLQGDLHSAVALWKETAAQDTGPLVVRLSSVSLGITSVEQDRHPTEVGGLIMAAILGTYGPGALYGYS